MTDNNGIKKQADDFLNTLTCRVQKPYPEAKVTFQNKPIAERLLSAFADGGNSELTALTQYFIHSQTISNKTISDTLFCIALDEMHHMEMISELIVSMGGELRCWSSDHAYWTGGFIAYGTSDSEKLSLDIFAEHEAIAGYESILRDIKQRNDPSLAQVETVIRRILEDESYHLNLLNEQYNAGMVSQ
jgi:rubrerythrin